MMLLHIQCATFGTCARHCKAAWQGQFQDAQVVHAFISNTVLRTDGVTVVCDLTLGCELLLLSFMSDVTMKGQQ